MDRLDVCGAQRPSRDRREARRRARRPEHQEQHLRVRPSPSARPATLLVADFADCALRRPAGSRRCTMRRSTAAPNPPWRCSSAAPTTPSRTTMGNAVPPTATVPGRPPNRPESAQANASPTRTRLQRARRVRRGGGGGAAAGIVRARLLRPARRDATLRHARSTAQTALFGLRRRTRGMMCASHCVPSAGVVGRQRVGREHSTLRLTVRGGAPHAAHTGT